MATPPSLPIITWLEFDGSNQIAWWSEWIFDAAAVFTVLPPSVVMCRSTPP